MQLNAWCEIWKVSPSLVSFFPLPSIVLLTHYFCFLCIYSCTHACHQLFCRSQCMGVCLLQGGPRQDAIRYVLLLWNCFIHWRFCYKITDSILGPAFLTTMNPLQSFCNSKTLPNKMQIKAVSIYVVQSRCITCGIVGKIKKNVWWSRTSAQKFASKFHTTHSAAEQFQNLIPQEFKRGLAPLRASGVLSASRLRRLCDSANPAATQLCITLPSHSSLSQTFVLHC